jgi:predicted Fe-Mo cluster-binding NifX family protein
MRAAFASIDGSYIDQHFGSARYWQIYDIETKGNTFVEIRKSKAKCEGHCEGGFDHLLDLLHDCDVIFVSKIGQTAAAFMISHGKRIFEAAGNVADIVEELKNGDFL